MELVGKQDPYVIMKVSKKPSGADEAVAVGEYKTMTVSKGGRDPVWTDADKATGRFDIDVARSDTVSVRMDAWDEDPGSSDFIGGGDLSLNDVLSSGGVGGEQNVALTNKKGKAAGHLVVAVSFVARATPAAAESPSSASAAPATSVATAAGPSPVPSAPATDVRGALFVIVHRGAALLNMDIGKQDPFVVVQLVTRSGSKADKVVGEFKTATIKSGGRDPVWSDRSVASGSIVLPSLAPADQVVLVVTAYDEDPVTNDLIGVGEVNVTESLNRGGPFSLSELAVALKTKAGKPAGQIVLSISNAAVTEPGAAGAGSGTLKAKVVAALVPVQVQVLSGAGLHNVNSFGKQDPYVALSVLDAGGNVVAEGNSCTVWSGGVDVTWAGVVDKDGGTDTVALSATSDCTLRVRVYDNERSGKPR